MKANDVKKFLLKNKELMAEFSHVDSVSLFYNVKLEDGRYQLTIDRKDWWGDIESIETLEFDKEIKASLLNRWVSKSIDSGEFIKID